MINNEEAFSKILPANFSGVFHWDYISKHLKKFGEDLGDIDARYHKRGWFLHFETKNGYSDKNLKGGYRIAAEDWIRQGQGYNVLMVLYAKDIKISFAELWTYNPNVYGRIDGMDRKFSCTAEGVLDYVKSFREHAMKNPKKW